jgi:transposase
MMRGHDDANHGRAARPDEVWAAIQPLLPPKRPHPKGGRPWIVESSTRLGRHRWKVERSLAWLLANRRLTVRYERRADILQAFLHLACALTCARRLQPW